ncbi:MAG: hypothetical protein IKP86_01340 [Anaerolineaceae bacterium]|nr:hypothetical protein [Anaerolineaceae bacterium]
MKKLLFVVIAVLMLAFASVSAQETTTELPTLSFHTVGNIFSWGDSAEDVYNFLKNYEEAGLVITPEVDETYGKTISAEYESEEEKFTYVFYFDNEEESLHEIECFSILAEGTDAGEVIKGLIDTYGLAEADIYESEITNNIISSFEAGVAVAGDSTIVVIAGDDETAESYASAAIYFFDRTYFENLN